MKIDDIDALRFLPEPERAAFLAKLAEADALRRQGSLNQAAKIIAELPVGTDGKPIVPYIWLLSDILKPSASPEERFQGIFSVAFGPPIGDQEPMRLVAEYLCFAFDRYDAYGKDRYYRNIGTYSTILLWSRYTFKS